jgi:hypothetical protein
MALFHWLYRQRQACKDDTLSSDRKEKLIPLDVSNNSGKPEIDESKFINDPNFEWYSKLQDLKQYKAVHGHLQVNPVSDFMATTHGRNLYLMILKDTHPDLANWVQEQQLSFKQGSLSSFKTKKLYNLGVLLDNESAEPFCDIESNTSETLDVESHMLFSATNETLSADIEHVPENEEWNGMFAKLEAFKESHGHVTVLLVRTTVQSPAYNI